MRGSVQLPSFITSIYMFLPFLHFDSYKAVIRRREMIRRRLGQGRTRPVPSTVSKTDSLELRVIWEFLGHDPPINCRRTLDQFGYPSLHDTRARDDDQMLYKMTKERVDANGMREPGLYRGAHEKRNRNEDASGDDASLDEDQQDENSDTDIVEEEDEEIQLGDDVLNGNLLMVDQLWMWTIDTSAPTTQLPVHDRLAVC